MRVRHATTASATLCGPLRRIPVVQATLEPRVTTSRGPGDQRRADIKVNKDGTTWLVDVGVVVCPGTQRLLALGTDTVPGLAAATYHDVVKEAKYGDQTNFVPFIVETGGRKEQQSSSTGSPARGTGTPRRTGRAGT
jgi:hypothetical protein